MFRKTTLAILSGAILLAGNTFALTNTSTTGQFTNLKKGDTAPFDGILFDPVATAKIISDKQFSRNKCALEIEMQKKLVESRCTRDVDILKAELQIETRKNNLIVTAQREEIDSLRKLAKGNDNTLWATIGFALGAVTSVAIFFAAVEIAQ